MCLNKFIPAFIKSSKTRFPTGKASCELNYVELGTVLYRFKYTLFYKKYYNYYYYYYYYYCHYYYSIIYSRHKQINV